MVELRDTGVIPCTVCNVRRQILHIPQYTEEGSLATAIDAYHILIGITPAVTADGHACINLSKTLLISQGLVPENNVGNQLVFVQWNRIEVVHTRRYS